MQINKFFSIPIITRTLIASALILLPLTSSATDIHSRILKMPIVNAIDHPQGVGAKVFAEEVAKNSNGKIKIKIFPNGTLGGEQQVASAMQGGTIEVSMMSPAQIVGTVPQFIVLDFPFTLKNEAQADAVLDGPFGKQLMSYMPEKGWVGLAYMEQGYRSISNNKRPINTLEDIKGLKIRTILRSYPKRNYCSCPLISRQGLYLKLTLPADADILADCDNPAHYADGFHSNVRSPLQGYAMLLLHSVSA